MTSNINCILLLIALLLLMRNFTDVDTKEIKLRIIRRQANENETTTVEQENEVKEVKASNATKPNVTVAPPPVPNRYKPSEKLNTLHMPCDMDIPFTGSYINFYPSHCVQIYNNRYQNEKAYRTFKMYQIEAFFFHRYNMRISRFEVEPHNFEYGGVVQKEYQYAKPIDNVWNYPKPNQKGRADMID